MRTFFKAIIAISAICFVALSCSKSSDTSDTSDLQRQIDEIKSVQIASINTQITNIKTSLGNLEAIDVELKAMINELKNSVESVDDIIEVLENADEALGLRIDQLKAYCDNQDNDVKNWASTTFATLEQHSAVLTEIANIKTQLSGLSQSISTLDTSISQKISDAEASLLTKISDAEDSVKSWVNEQLTGYYTIAQADAKIAALKTNLEGQLSEQKTQLQTLITNLESTLEQKIKNNADDIEEIKGLIATCNTLIEQNAQAISANATAISQLQTDLATARTEITAAYQQAISTAINTLDGRLTGQIATEVATINSRIDDEIDEINETISALTARVSQCEKDIKTIKNTIYAMQQDIEDLQEQVAAILARIQSIAFVPAYSDGKVPVSYTDNGTLTPGTAALDYELQPASTANELAQVWQTALKMKAVYTITKTAPETVQLAITSVSADKGYLSVTISGSALSEDFFRSRCSANAALVISDGNNELASEYVPLVPWTTDIISFGCPNFKAYCVENFDTNGDGEISEDEAKEVTSITASMLNITSLVGIEYFSNLETVDVSFNKLETLDLSHSPKLTSVLINGNKLQSLSLSGLTGLQTLDCSNNKLTALNVSESEGLKTLICSGNIIGALNVKKNKALIDLQCSNNQLAALDLKNNTTLETLYCRKNIISVLDVTKLTVLKNFDCSNNTLTSLNLYQNTLLETLYCGNNSLTSLGVSANTVLTVLDCSGNTLTALDITKNAALETLSCANNTMTSLDVSRNASLLTVNCKGNLSMAKLWVKDAAQVATLTIQKEDITQIAYNDGGINIPDAKLKSYLLALFDDDEDGEISIVEAENVQNVNCSGLDIADLTGLECCPNLKYLNFANNTVAVADLPNLQKLETVVAYGNALTRLNMNNDIALKSLYIIDVNTNALSGASCVIEGFSQSASLKIGLANTPYTSLTIKNNPALSALDVTDNTQLTELTISDNQNLTSLNVSTLESLTNLDVNACGLTSLDVSHNIELASLDCSSNALTTLNVDNNTALVNFDCSDNDLSTLRVTNNNLLDKLDCSNNALANVNVRKNTQLKTLNVSGNTAITALALGYNSILEYLNAAKTGLADIDLSSNTILKTLDVSTTNIVTLANVEGPCLSSLACDEIPISPALFNVGSTITIDNQSGVVFSKNEGYAKMISQDATTLTFGSWVSGLSSSNGEANTNTLKQKGISGYPAAEWCTNKGSAWYLPAIDEFVEVDQGVFNINTDTMSSTLEYSSSYTSSTGTFHYAYRIYIFSSSKGKHPYTSSYDSSSVNASAGNCQKNVTSQQYSVRAMRKIFFNNN